MATIDTIPTSDATVPAALKSMKNGGLPEDWLRSFDGTTRDDFKMFVPVSYAMQALHIAARSTGIDVRTTGRYRSYARQEALFRSRYTPNDNDGCGSKTWQGQTWYLQRSDRGGCYAMAATPGTSNHGLGIADDIAEQRDADPEIESLSDRLLGWLRDNAPSFGFGLDTRVEPWHWHWYQPANPNTLSQRAVDTLRAAGVTIPDLSRFGFTVPGATPPPPTDVPRVARFGGTPQGGWGGWYSVDNAKTRLPLDSMDDARHMTITLHGVDAKTLLPPADPENWTDVVHTNDEAELTRLLGVTPGTTPPTPPPPTPGGTVLLYRVVSGDSYWKIVETVSEDGKATQSRVEALQAANSNKALQPGDLINVPGRVAV